MDIYFVSSNDDKIKEYHKLLKGSHINMIPYKRHIAEIQDKSLKNIVKNKVTEAYSMIQRPVMVEHTGLIIPDFGGMPNGFTQIIWDALKAEKFCEYFGEKQAVAKTMIAFCDGREILSFSGQIKGHIASTPVGMSTFGWDNVFVPDKYTETFAEMKKRKNKISMRKKSVKKLIEYMEKKYAV